ncbi:hypothetical protein KPH14_003626 [Odynerus spinipes]|uniref:Uncharacterized protein n=1 Tax=Odynerus spinipes TaxID=1348599 RepID=A0AAD9RD33_9HYME|nr:hypothetical protein KPH14_003626 [Odynerus spinipes]
MSDKQKEKSRVYITGRKSVNQAMELLKTRLDNKKRSWNNKDDERSRKIMLHCTNVPWQKKSCTSLTGFSKTLFMLEVRMHLAKHNWKLIQRLFSFLPDYSNEIEYLMWRYALIILLYSPNSDSSNLQQFLELCIGNQGLNDKEELERLLLLQNRNLPASIL